MRRLPDIIVALVLILVSVIILVPALGALRNLVVGLRESPAYVYWLMGIGGTILGTLGIVSAVIMLVRARRRS